MSIQLEVAAGNWWFTLLMIHPDTGCFHTAYCHDKRAVIQSDIKTPSSLKGRSSWELISTHISSAWTQIQKHRFRNTDLETQIQKHRFRNTESETSCCMSENIWEISASEHEEERGLMYTAPISTPPWIPKISYICAVWANSTWSVDVNPDSFSFIECQLLCHSVVDIFARVSFYPLMDVLFLLCAVKCINSKPQIVCFYRWCCAFKVYEVYRKGLQSRSVTASLLIKHN